MAYPRKAPFVDKYYNGRIADISTANDAAHIPIMSQGVLISVGTAIANAITRAAATISVLKYGTAITGATITVTQTGSAEDDFDSVDLTGTPVDFGDVIQVSSDGGSSTACVADVTLVVRES